MTAVQQKEQAPLGEGRILQVMGPVVDIQFEGDLPEIYTALLISNPAISDEPDNLVCEIAQHLGENVVRTIAMDTTDGLVRGMRVKNSGEQIMMPVGRETLGRILNVIGEMKPSDAAAQLKKLEAWLASRPEDPVLLLAAEFVLWLRLQVYVIS